MAGFDASAATPSSAVPRSPWHSPVPYLFGGLAAMLGLIAFALLILACSYWKLSGYLENSSDDGERDLEADGGDGDSKPVMEEKYLVIMAGQENPTFLATPMTSRASSFGSKSSCSTSTTLTTQNSTLSEPDFQEKDIQNGGHLQIQAHQQPAAADQVVH